MELMQLKYFLEAASREHITAAAEALHIAQPALSQAIKRLEEELGVPLFERNGRGVVLTRYGSYVQKEVAPALQTLEGMRDKLAAMAKLENQTVHINVLAASSATTSAIIKYRKKHPEINFQLIQGEDMALCDISVATRLFYQAMGADAISLSEEIFLAVPREGKFGERESIALSEVKEEPFIGFSDSKQFRSVCDRICSGVGFEPHIVLESDNVETVKNAIGAGLGIGFWPAATWGNIRHNGVVLLPIHDPVCRRDVIVAKNTHKTDMHVVNDFYRFLSEQLRDRIENYS